MTTSKCIRPLFTVFEIVTHWLLYKMNYTFAMGRLAGFTLWAFVQLFLGVPQVFAGVCEIEPKIVSLPPNIVVPPADNVLFTVHISKPACAGGELILLSLAPGTRASVPSAVTILADDDSAEVILTGFQEGVETLSASNFGNSAMTNVYIKTLGILLDPPSNQTVPLNQLFESHVSLTMAAPDGGIVINVASDNSSIATVSPASVLVNGGETVAAQFVTVTPVSLGSIEFSVRSPGLTGGMQSITITAVQDEIFDSSFEAGKN